MKTLIIPCAGKSSRFPNMKPKWMLTHPSGKLMVQEAIAGLPLQKFDRILIPILKEHAKKFDEKLVFEQAFAKHKPKVEFIELDESRSQSDTIFQTLVKGKVKGAFVSKDADNFVAASLPARQDFVVGVDINKIDKDISRLKAKSFIVVNEQGLIVDIIEKRIVSENICVGVYGFSDAQKFIGAYKTLSKNSKDGEIYPSHIISYLIGTGKSVYSYVEAQGYEDWGTSVEWQATQNRYATYFVDVDGVLLHNSGRYGKKHWLNHLSVIEGNVAAIKRLADNGAQIVITTSRGEEHLATLKKMLKQKGVKVHAYVTNCNHAARVMINDFASTNPYPSARAINIPRDGSLDIYL
jgi:predicted dinucleotide-binding enzyme